MKTILLLFALTFSIPVYSQVLPDSIKAAAPAIDLKLANFDEAERVKRQNKGEMQLLAGSALSVLGMGLGVLVPMFTTPPTDPTLSHLLAVQGTEDPTEIKALNSKYTRDMVTYDDKVNQYNLKDESFRLVGLGVFTLGASFNIAGICTLTRKITR